MSENLAAPSDLAHVEVPNFGAVLAEFITAVPADAQPRFLARLERSAAARYRYWADKAEGQARAVLLSCAKSEDEIADRVDALFPAVPEHEEAMDTLTERAVATYMDVFAERSLREQLYLQSRAELQGSAAWRGMAENATGELREALLGLCVLEEQSSRALGELLEKALV